MAKRYFIADKHNGVFEEHTDKVVAEQAYEYWVQRGIQEELQYAEEEGLSYLEIEKKVRDFYVMFAR